MVRCENCDAELQPQWKFCVRCGAKVTTATSAPVPVDPTPIVESRLVHAPEPAPAAPAIPAAIRPHELTADVEPPAGRRFDWHVLVGILVGVVGAAVIVYLIVALTSAGGSTP